MNIWKIWNGIYFDISILLIDLYTIGGYSNNDEYIDMFWDVAGDFTDERRRKLLKFVTSCSRPPLLGFKVPWLFYFELH